MIYKFCCCDKTLLVTVYESFKQSIANERIKFNVLWVLVWEIERGLTR